MPHLPARDLTRELADRYDRDAAAYRELWAPILMDAGIRLLSEATPAGVHRVLDVGAGVGALLPHLKRAFPEALVLGVDRSPGMLALAPPAFPRSVMDATRLAMRPASVDLVLMMFMLFHLEEPLDGLREARRVLRDGGQVRVVTWGGDLESEATRIWSECLDAHGAPPLDPASASRHELVDRADKMEALLARAGFAGTRCWEVEMASPMAAEHVIRLRTTLGAARPRYDGLPCAAQASCVAEARRRMDALTPEGHVARGQVVFSIGDARCDPHFAPNAARVTP